MFIAWVLGVLLMASSGWMFFLFKKKYCVPYGKFIFENSNENGLLAPRDWEEYKKSQKMERTAKIQGAIFGKPLV